MLSLFKKKRLNDSKSFNVSVIVKHSYDFLEGGLFVEQQWQAYQNRIAAGFL